MTNPDDNAPAAITPTPKLKSSPLPKATQHSRFIKMLRKTANVSKSARAGGFATSTAYSRRAKEPKFRAAWDAALSEALDNLEEVLRDRAVNGVERQHFHGGNVTGTYRTYSDQLGMFILRGRRQDIYGRELPTCDEPASNVDRINQQLDLIAARVKARELSADKPDEE